MIKKIFFACLMLVVILNLSYRIDIGKTPHELIGELMYFPSGFAMRTLSVGYHVPLADVVWLRFIQYYGEHRMTDARFELMYHILDILTSLDPRFLYSYTLGALMLTHDAQRPDQAEALLKKGMHSNPDEWRIPFTYGFINYVFLKDYRVAQTYFRVASMKPDAPDMPRRWYAYITYLKLGELKTSLTLWIDLYNNTKNPEEKEIASFYIKKIKMQIDIDFLNQKIRNYTDEMGHPPGKMADLLISGFIDKIPEEPHGENYYIRNGEAQSTWDQNK
jgi:tetratricopeptide (TPR) repeat protein